MNKAYSNKALPAGTVLREWRLEDVLGVGGFGIVYKARGIYFDELVAIKEYFPSSISERDAEDTVVPIDSDAEEVHALGLKKFVEEAKLLWNLSTPTRHPNIVSVRSLFEIHGTAYMVMDFEDGTSLSKMLKQGRKFNERSLWSIIQPVAEGLDRAHRVGVLHRDIKPPNILINEDGRPVLIDFGSARFEAAEATSTKVTFHTPPYAALEQYVKTYPQGPWTDIYALGVVLHECITGEKPPEVLERLHGGLGTPLSEGKWAGYGKQFLAAVDAAMTVKPDDRPQSIPEWLELFGKSDKPRVVAGADQDATRFYTKREVAKEEIVPVAAPEGVEEVLETGVPADPSEVQFKRAGEETGAKRRKPPTKKKEAEVIAAEEEEAPAVPPPLDRGRPEPSRDTGKEPFKPKPAVIAAGAAALLVAGVGGWAMLGRGGPESAPATNEAAPPVDTSVLEAPATPDANLAAPTEQPLANEGQTVAAPATPVPPSADQKELEKLRREAAKAAQTQARLEALRKAQAKAAQQANTQITATPKPGKSATSSTSAPSSSSGGVSPAKLAQLDSIVDDARSMAKRVMRSSNSANASLARNYDSNLKTLKASARGVSSDRDLDRLIKQANQTRAYVQFLVKQSQ
jgi:non-specific serine/threonine protein kinase